MLERSGTIRTTITASEDGTHTFEVRKTIEGMEGRTAIVIELYPTLTAEKIYSMDISTMHLVNHMQEIGWKEVRILNLFSKVCDRKPLASNLIFDSKNLVYFEELLETEETADYDIVIAWGSTLDNNKVAKEMKIEFLKLLKEKGLEGQVKQFSVDDLQTRQQGCPHPLFLGLRHARETWHLENFPLERILSGLENGQDTDREKQAPGQEQGGSPAEEKEAGQDEKEEEIPPDGAENEPTGQTEAKKKRGRKPGRKNHGKNEESEE